jgi:transcriptional regulator with XRE-family HTH domain
MTKEDLRQWLKDRKWTQQHLAERLGVTKRQVSRWATGRAPVPIWFEKVKDLL